MHAAAQPAIKVEQPQQSETRLALIASFMAVDIQPVKMKCAFTQSFATKFDEMAMVGEENYLRALGQRGQLRENRRSSIIVTGDQQIIQDKGHRLMLLEITIKCSQTKCQIELIPCAITHSCNRDRRLIRAQAHQSGGVVGIELRA